MYHWEKHLWTLTDRQTPPPKYANFHTIHQKLDGNEIYNEINLKIYTMYNNLYIQVTLNFQNSTLKGALFYNSYLQHTINLPSWCYYKILCKHYTTCMAQWAVFLLPLITAKHLSLKTMLTSKKRGMLCISNHHPTQPTFALVTA